MSERKVQVNDKIKVHYKGTLNSGEEFDSSYKRDKPLTFRVGKQEVIKGFEDGVKNMQVGEKKSLVIPPEDAYGKHDNALIQSVNRSVFPKDIELREGSQFLIGENEYQTMVRILSIEGDKVTLDANHMLAGQTLNFEIELVEIV